MVKSLLLLKRKYFSFFQSNNGVAAVEFAMILPILLVLYLGMVVVTAGISTNRKLTLVTRSIADLAGRASSVDNTEMNNIFGAAQSVLSPYSTDGLRMVITSVSVKKISQNVFEGRVCWSKSNTGSGQKAANSIITVPDGFKFDQTTYILAETSMPYNPIVTNSVITGPITLRDTTPWPVRNVREVLYQGVTPCLT